MAAKKRTPKKKPRRAPAAKPGAPRYSFQHADYALRIPLKHEAARDANDIARFLDEAFADDDVTPLKRLIIGRMAAQLHLAKVEYAADGTPRAAGTPPKAEAVLRSVRAIDHFAPLVVATPGSAGVFHDYHAMGLLDDLSGILDQTLFDRARPHLQDLIKLLKSWVSDVQPAVGKHNSIGILTTLCIRFELLGYGQRRDPDGVRRSLAQALRRARKTEGTQQVP